MANPARAYLATQVETTTQGELLLMLYEAAIKFLKRAKIEIDNKDFAKKGIYISKAMAIIHELSESLNKEKGGDITPQLAQLYMFCTTQLVKANIRLDKKMIDDVIKILDGLRSAYAQIIPAVEGKGAPAGAPTQAPKPQAVQAPQAPPIQANANMQQPAQQPIQSQTPPVAKQENTAQKNDAQPSKEAAPPQPAPITPTPPKLRSAANAAKFRAANAYTNTVR